MSYSSSIVSPEVKLHDAATSFAVPTDNTFGADVTVQRDANGNAPSAEMIRIEGSAATTLTGPVGLYGYLASSSKMYLIGILNNGADIVIPGANTGFAQEIEFATIFDRLSIGPLTGTLTPSGGASVTVYVNPIQTTVR